MRAACSSASARHSGKTVRAAGWVNTKRTRLGTSGSGVEQAETGGDGGPRRVPGHDVAGRADHEGGRRIERVEHRRHGRRDLCRERHLGGAEHLVAALHAEVEEMAALVVVESHGVGQGQQHRRRRVQIASLLETHEVVDTDAGQGGDLLAPQPRRAAPTGVGQPDISGRGLLTARPQVGAELTSRRDVDRHVGHLPIMP